MVSAQILYKSFVHTAVFCENIYNNGKTNKIVRETRFVESSVLYVVSQGLHPMYYGPLARSVKLRVAHAPGIPGALSPSPRVSDRDMHHGTCATHVPWCMRGSLTSGFPWSRWRGKRSRNSRRMSSPRFYVSGKRPIAKFPFCCVLLSGASCFIQIL